MTNKLPVVGKRYRIIGGQYTPEIKGFFEGYVMTTRINGEPYPLSTIETFFRLFEELPEDKAETKPETQNHISELSPEVKEAMELMQFQIDHHDKSYVTEVDPRFLPPILLKVLERAKNLLNALDKQFNLPQKKLNLGQNGEGFGAVLGKNRVGGLENKESIWKPINSLKTNELVPAGFVRKNKGYQATFSLTHQTVKEWGGIIKEFCSLDYFLNDYEKLKERVKKLEEK